MYTMCYSVTYDKCYVCCISIYIYIYIYTLSSIKPGPIDSGGGESSGAPPESLRCGQPANRESAKSRFLGGSLSLVVVVVVLLLLLLLLVLVVEVISSSSSSRSN